MTKQFATPGPRAIYPELCSSPSLGRCSILANALFPRLVAMADDQGRLLGDPQSVLVECLGRLLRLVALDEVQAALEELEREEVLQRYTSAGQEYIQLAGWWRWQGSMRRAYPSRWPAPRGWTDLVYGLGGEPQTFAEAVSQGSPRNAALRGILPRIATPRASARASAGASARARAMPDRASADAVPSRANGSPPGAEGAGGLRRRAEEILADPHASQEARDGAQAMLNLGGKR